MQPQPAVRAEHVWPLLAAAFALAVYGSGVAPGLVGGDSPELIVAGVTLGIPHQPGYPLYTLLARIAAMLPGDPTTAINAMSAVAGAVAAGAGAVLARRWGAPGPAAAALSAIACTGWPMWGQAVVAEVYALGAALGLLSVVAIDRWLVDGRRRSLFSAAYVTGLAVSHQPLALMIALGGAATLLIARVRERLAVGTVIAALALFALPFSAFLMLPIRSGGDLAIDYAQIEAPADFFYHALGVASRSELLSEGGAGIRATGDLFRRLVVDGAGHLTPIVVLLGFAGLVSWWRGRSPRAVLATVPVAAIVAFSFVYAILDVENYAILPWWLVVLAGAPVVGWLSRSRAGEVATAIALVVVAATGVAANRDRCDRSDYHLVDDFVANVTATVPRDGALFLFTETLFTPFLHQAVVREERTDIARIDMTGKVARERLGFRGLGGDWRENRWRRLERLYIAPPPALADRPWRALMFTPREGPDPRIAYRPVGLTMDVGRRDDPVHETPLREWERLTLRLPHPSLVAVDQTGFSLTPTILRLTHDLALRASDEATARGAAEKGELILRQALDLAPRSTEARTRLASLLLATGRHDEAENELRMVIEFEGESPGALSALGVVRLQRGDPGEAESLFSRAIELDPELPIAHANLGFLLSRDPNRVPGAIHHLEEFLRLAPDDPSAPAARQFLDRLRRP